MLYLKCQGQVVSIDVDERLADKYINANTVHWEFCERWAGMVITAQFTQVQKNEETGKDEKRTFNVLVDEVTNTTTMPNEIVAGDVDISAFGEHPVTGVRITTVPIKKRIDKSGFVGDGEIPIPPTLNLYSQLIGRINENSIPYIGENGNWWVGKHDSGVVAAEIEESIEAAERAESAAAKAEAANENIEETVTDLRHDINALADTMALLHAGVPDTSAKAASHTLHAQDAPMSITLYGQTYQEEGTPSPDSPKAISGVDVAKVHCGGKNLIDLEQANTKLEISNGEDISQHVVRNEDGTTTVRGGLGSHGGRWLAGMRIPVFEGEKYTISADVFLPEEHTSTRVCFGLGTQTISWANSETGVIGEWTRLSHTFVINKTQMARALVMSSASYGIKIKNLMVVHGEDTAYEPYNANVIDMTTALNGEALYGNGTVMDTVENDVLVDGERKCKVTRMWRQVTFDGSSNENWVFNTVNKHGLFQFYMSGMPERTGSGISNMFPWNVQSSSDHDCIYMSETAVYMILKPETIGFVDESANKVSTLREFLSAKPVQLLYKLKTPEVYYTDPVELRKPANLTPVTVTGSGETAVGYSCDTKSYIDRKFDALAAALIGG